MPTSGTLPGQTREYRENGAAEECFWKSCY